LKSLMKRSLILRVFLITTVLLTGCSNGGNSDGPAQSGDATIIADVLNAPQNQGTIRTIGNATRVEFQGQVRELVDGTVYDVVGTQRTPVDEFYDANFVRENYRQSGGVVYRIVPGYGEAVVHRSLADSFEDAEDIHDLIKPPPTSWTSMTIQSPASPTVADYVRLRSRILNRQVDFADNRIDVVTNRQVDGSKSLRFYATEPSRRMSITKTSIDNELFYLKNGDQVEFSGWFFLESGRLISLVDFESDYMVEAPGIRLMFDGGMRPFVELKFAMKPVFTMNLGRDFVFPTGEWVKVDLHLLLADSENGRVELWMNDEKLIDQTGRTMILHDAIYNSLQVGITASPRNTETVLYADSISVKTTP